MSRVIRCRCTRCGVERATVMYDVRSMTPSAARRADGRLDGPEERRQVDRCPWCAFARGEETAGCLGCDSATGLLANPARLLYYAGALNRPAYRCERCAVTYTLPLPFVLPAVPGDLVRVGCCSDVARVVGIRLRCPVESMADAVWVLADGGELDAARVVAARWVGRRPLPDDARVWRLVAKSSAEVSHVES
jgi:hypothetical protein